VKRGGPIRRRTPVRPVNQERLDRRRAKQFGPQSDLARSLPCCVCSADPPSDPHHVCSRGAGGVDADCVSLCRACHSELHRIGRRSFEWLHGIDLKAEARRLAKQLASGDQEV